jgi:hypothetical protein
MKPDEIVQLSANLSSADLRILITELLSLLYFTARNELMEELPMLEKLGLRKKNTEKK